MPFGREVGLGPGDSMLDGPSSPSPFIFAVFLRNIKDI